MRYAFHLNNLFCRIQYTQLLAVGLEADQVKMVSLRTVLGYTNVLLMNEEILLCAVKEGDNNYPYAIKWDEHEGTSYKLIARCMINDRGLPLALAQVCDDSRLAIVPLII